VNSGKVEGGVALVGEVGVTEEGGVGANEAGDEGKGGGEDGAAEADWRLDPGGW